MSVNRVRQARIGLIIIAALSMMLAIIFVAPPSADAQGRQFFRDVPIAVAADLGVPCDPIGTVTDPAAPNPGEYCRAVGFVPVTSLAICQEASALFETLYLFDNPTSTCYVEGFGTSNPCEPPTVFTDGTDQVLTDGQPFSFVGCNFPLLVMDSAVQPPPPPPPASMRGFEPTQAVACIESAEIQSDPGAAELSLGQIFSAETGLRTMIISGAPTCEFTGAGCDASLNLFEVSDVGTCLAALAAAEAAVAEEAVAEVTVEVNPSVPAAQAVAVQELALTGEEHEFGAAFAGALVGTGVSILAFGRLLHIRRKED